MSEKIKTYGLVGKNIAYSFSRNYFSEKFKNENLNNHFYGNFDLDSIDEFPLLFDAPENKNLAGMNVTIPYKEKVGAFLDEIDAVAKEIGAINTIKIEASGKRIGFNTDVYGFSNSLKPLLNKTHKKALILGTGGASKAVAYTFKQLSMDYLFVSRTPSSTNQISYEDLSVEILSEYTVIVNCSPMGTSPDVHLCPAIPYQFLTENHLLYDLIYNPAVTTFLQKGIEKGAATKNGLEMLELQAGKSWEIWNQDL